MAFSATDSVVDVGSGRSRLPARLRTANFAATVLAAVQALAADTVMSFVGPVRLKNYTTAQRNTLASGYGVGQKGYMVYDSTLDCVVVWTGAAWDDTNGADPA